jgi:hypothetical protein
VLALARDEKEQEQRKREREWRVAHKIITVGENHP